MGDVGLGEHSAIGLHYSIGTQGGAPAWREAGASMTGRCSAASAEAITSRAARSIIQARAADAGIDGRVSGHTVCGSARRSRSQRPAH